MTERWRKPVIPIAIENETRYVEVVSGGVSIPQQRKDVELVLKDEDVQRIAQGYVCINCLEPLEHPYPEKCPVCSYPMRELQALQFAEKYNGTEPALTPLEDRLAAMDEEELKQDYVGKPQILVPKGFRAKA